MGSFSVWHWLIVIFWCAIFIVPAWRIASRAGFPGALSLLIVIPIINIVLLWVFAFVKWPREKGAA
jgi:hypothetical protein